MTNPLPQSAALATDITIGQKMLATCPSCNKITMFTFIGVQEWPMRVAAALNVNQQVNLWHCNRCETTLSGNTFEE